MCVGVWDHLKSEQARFNAWRGNANRNPTRHPDRHTDGWRSWCVVEGGLESHLRWLRITTRQTLHSPPCFIIPVSSVTGVRVEGNASCFTKGSLFVQLGRGKQNSVYCFPSICPFPLIPLSNTFHLCTCIFLIALLPFEAVIMHFPYCGQPSLVNPLLYWNLSTLIRLFVHWYCLNHNGGIWLRQNFGIYTWLSWIRRFIVAFEGVTWYCAGAL